MIICDQKKKKHAMLPLMSSLSKKYCRWQTDTKRNPDTALYTEIQMVV